MEGAGFLLSTQYTLDMTKNARKKQSAIQITSSNDKGARAACDQMHGKPQK